MIRKKGPSAPKFELSLVYVVTCPPEWSRQRHCAGRMLRSWRAAGNGLDIARGLGPVAGDDGAGEPAEHDGVVGGHAGRDRPVDPGFLVDVLIYDGLAAHGGD